MSLPSPLDGRVALVTGATRNIGRGIAHRLASDGARVVMNYHRDDDRAATVVREIEDAGGVARALRADVASANGVARAFEAAALAFDTPPDVVVANAGLTPTPAPIAETTDEEVEGMLALNVRGVFYVLRESARRVPDGGRVVVVGSGVALAAPPGLGIYAATKAAVASLVRTLAKEVGARGVTVNAVLPGPTTDDPPENEAETDEARLSVFGRMGRPADIASAVAFLAREDAQWVTGAEILTSGGAFL